MGFVPVKPSAGARENADTQKCGLGRTTTFETTSTHATSETTSQETHSSHATSETTSRKTHSAHSWLRT